MLKKIAIVLAAVILVPIATILLIALSKPNTFYVERSARIQAPPEKIFQLINDLQRFTTWSPFEIKDMERAFSGPESGKGAAYDWESEEAGKGRLEITESSPPDKVVMSLSFVRPFETQNEVEFTLKPEGERTVVTWSMHGPMVLASKVLSVFVDIDEMIGNDYERGLQSLKKLAET